MSVVSPPNLDNSNNWGNVNNDGNVNNNNTNNNNGVAPELCIRWIPKICKMELTLDMVMYLALINQLILCTPSSHSTTYMMLI